MKLAGAKNVEFESGIRVLETGTWNVIFTGRGDPGLVINGEVGMEGEFQAYWLYRKTLPMRFNKWACVGPRRQWKHAKWSSPKTGVHPHIRF